MVEKKLKATVDVGIYFYAYLSRWEDHTRWFGISYTQSNYYSVAEVNTVYTYRIIKQGGQQDPNGRLLNRGTRVSNYKVQYCKQLDQWDQEANILTIMFEAFDEPWKGSDEPQSQKKTLGFTT